MNRLWKKTRHSTTKKHRSTFYSISNKHVLSTILFKTIFLVTNTCLMLAVLAMQSFIKCNTKLIEMFIIQFFNYLHIVNLLINLELLVIDIFYNIGYQLFHKDVLIL